MKRFLHYIGMGCLIGVGCLLPLTFSGCGCGDHPCDNYISIDYIMENRLNDPLTVRFYHRTAEHQKVYDGTIAAKDWVILHPIYEFNAYEEGLLPTPPFTRESQGSSIPLFDSVQYIVDNSVIGMFTSENCDNADNPLCSDNYSYTKMNDPVNGNIIIEYRIVID